MCTLYCVYWVWILNQKGGGTISVQKKSQRRKSATPILNTFGRTLSHPRGDLRSAIKRKTDKNLSRSFVNIYIITPKFCVIINKFRVIIIIITHNFFIITQNLVWLCKKRHHISCDSCDSAIRVIIFIITRNLVSFFYIMP